MGLIAKTRTMMTRRGIINIIGPRTARRIRRIFDFLEGVKENSPFESLR